MKGKKNQIVIFIISMLIVCPAYSYEVWMGTHLMTHTDATDLSTWSMTASQLEGYNVNRAPHDTDPATNDDWRTIIAQFTNANSTGYTMSEVARSEVTKNPLMVDELAFPYIDDRLSIIFGFENTFGYDLDILMFYDERGTYQGTEYLYEWTDIEVDYMRQWLDGNGHADVELMWNVRNNSVRNRYYAAYPLVDLIQIEASTTAFLNNTNNQITFLEWFWDDPDTINKKVALQIPRALPEDPYNQYEGTRRLAVMLGGILGYGEDGVRGDRLIFLPVTYNDNFPYTPETVSNGSSYTNTLTSICLSLLEQRELFEGRLPTLPTNADADSVVRTAPPSISTITDQVVSINTATAAIPFTVADTDTPATSLSVTANSSDTAVVPSSGIVLGGSGGNRTITITPASGQSGLADITVIVSDGMWSDSTTFTLTVGGILLSEASDASVKDSQVLVDQTSETTLLGAGGVNPWVDRCTVYVFQLPDLGPIANPFTNASFSFYYDYKDGTLKDNDLYGLGRRDTATVFGSDYYGQSTTSDPSDATRLQTNILTNSTSFGVIKTSIDGRAALLDYLNAQYESGAGISKYVFLRLNTTAPKTGINRARLTMSEGGVFNTTMDTRPRIAYTVQSIQGAHYPLDGDVIEFGGSGYDGILVGGSFAPSLVQHDQGLVLDGVDDYVEVPGYKGITGTASRTCSAWIKTTSVPGEIISWGSSDLGNKWIVRVNETGSLRAEVSGGYIYGTTPINDGLWHHVAVVLDSDGGPNISEVQLYVDGQLDPVADVLAYPINTAAAQDVNIGVYSTVGTRYFQGQIDDVRIYSSALSEAEIQALALITPPSPDIVRDYVIDLADLSVLSAYWLSVDCFSNNLCDGRDLNSDQVVNKDDLLVMLQLWLSAVDLPLVTPVDDFESYAVDTVMNNQTSPGTLGGLWDSDDEGTWHSTRAGKVILEGTNQAVYQEYRNAGRRTLCVNGLSDPIDEGETGVLFFRFKAHSTTSSISWYAGVHDLTGSDPLTVSSADETGKLVAGFHAVSAGGSTFDIKSVDDSATLLTGLSQDQWYSVWMVVNNSSDMFDLYIEAAADGAGEAGELPATAVGSSLPFEISTSNSLTGGLWHQAGGNGSNMIFDEVAWSGELLIP